MATATTNRPSVKQLRSRLRRTKRGLTAAQLGTTAAHLRTVPGVVQVGTVRTGKAGRPAILFGWDDAAEQAASQDGADE